MGPWWSEKEERGGGGGALLLRLQLQLHRTASFLAAGQIITDRLGLQGHQLETGASTAHTYTHTHTTTLAVLRSLGAAEGRGGTGETGEATAQRGRGQGTSRAERGDWMGQAGAQSFLHTWGGCFLRALACLLAVLHGRRCRRYGGRYVMSFVGSARHPGVCLSACICLCLSFPAISSFPSLLSSPLSLPFCLLLLLSLRRLLLLLLLKKAALAEALSSAANPRRRPMRTSGWIALPFPAWRQPLVALSSRVANTAGTRISGFSMGTCLPVAL